MLSIDEFIRTNMPFSITIEELLTELELTIQRLEQMADCAEQGRKLRQLAAAAKQPLMVMVMGEFKSGKSTFINTLLGRQLLQTDATPATAVVTMLTGGSPEKVEAHRLDGTIKEYSFQDLPMLTAAGDKGQELRDQLEYVHITIDIPLLSRITLIDTPGLNDADKNRSAATKRFMDRADMVIWVFRPEVKRSEIAIMDKLPQHIKPLGIINRIDEIDDEDDDIDEIIANVQRSVGSRVSELYPLSAYQAQSSLCDEDADLYATSRWAGFQNGLAGLVDRAGDLKQHVFIKKMIEEICSWASEEHLTTGGMAAITNGGKLICTFLGFIKDKLEIYTDISEVEKRTLLFQIGCFYVIGYKPDEMELAKGCLTYSASQGNVIAQSLLGSLYASEKSYTHDFKQAAYWFSKAAEQGDRHAQQNIARLYKEGNGVEQDYAKAACWYKKAAEQEDAVSQSNLAWLYENGYGVEQNYKEAVHWYTNAAEQGDDAAQNNLAGLYLEGKGIEQDYKKAAYWYEKAAEQGINNAQLAIAWLYGNGKGIELDYQKAFYWYEKAAEQGNANAQNNLAGLYLEGKGIEQDYQKAFYLYEKVAEQGFASAQNSLAMLYEEGKGIVQDYRQAAYWYEKAAEHGFAAAQKNLARLYREGKGVEQNVKTSIFWYKKAAEHGEPEGEFLIGLLYYAGKKESGVEGKIIEDILASWEVFLVMPETVALEIDYGEARNWFAKSAEQGYAPAQLFLGWLYYKGRGVEQNYNEASYWFTEAAVQGCAEAQAFLGKLYELGRGVDENLSKAKNWYEKSANQGCAAGQYFLGMYFNAQTNKDWLMHFWLRQAAKQGVSEACGFLLLQKLFMPFWFLDNELILALGSKNNCIMKNFSSWKKQACKFRKFIRFMLGIGMWFLIAVLVCIMVDDFDKFSKFNFGDFLYLFGILFGMWFLL